MSYDFEVECPNCDTTIRSDMTGMELASRGGKAVVEETALHCTDCTHLADYYWEVTLDIIDSEFEGSILTLRPVNDAVEYYTHIDGKDEIQKLAMEFLAHVENSSYFRLSEEDQEQHYYDWSDHKLSCDGMSDWAFNEIDHSDIKDEIIKHYTRTLGEINPYG